MRLFCTITVLLAATCLPPTESQKQALFIKRDIIESVRQGTSREYLPPINTQKPRPFQPVTQGNGIAGGYPPAGSVTPVPPFNGDAGVSYLPPVEHPNFNGYPGTKPSQPFPPTTPGYPSGPTAFPSFPTGYPSGPTAFPSFPTGNPSGPTAFPSFPTGNPSGPTAFPTIPNGYPSGPTAFPSIPTGYPSGSTGSPGTTAGYPSTGYPGGPNTAFPITGFPTTTPGFGTTYPALSTGYQTSSPRPFPTIPSTTTTDGGFPNDIFTELPSTKAPFTSIPGIFPGLETTTLGPEENTIPSESPEEPSEAPDFPTEATESPTELRSGGEDQHPPHIHAIDVECSKEMMTINIEFNKEYNGIIYSKGHYNNPDCRYVQESSGDTKFSFTVSLNSCGTEFVNAFDTEGKSYLENVLVLQNEPAIQEVWDTVRSVRCLWEGNLKKALNVALSVDMLNQEIVTFSGDTAMAKLDIQMGKGPFAPAASGLVKIGEVMTLVVSVTGDPGFDIQVKDCRAKDSSGENSVALTDERGCVLKPKLFGAFQKTRNTGDSEASIIAYAFFNAFKFPDVMDLVLECNVDLCKTDCEICPEPNQKTEPGRRRRRDLYNQNSTNDDSVTVEKRIRVFLPEDLNESIPAFDLSETEGSICMSTQGFVLSSAALISLLTLSCIFSAYMWLQHQRCVVKK